MENKVHVYFGSNLRKKNVRLATFDTMDEADEFVMTVVKAMNMKHSYIKKQNNQTLVIGMIIAITQNSSQS